MKVLLIEDDIRFSEGVRSHLKNKFCDITIVENVEDVYELGAHDVWDVIVVSLSCPGIFCFTQLCIAKMPGVKVIAISTRYSLHEKLKCYELGTEIYLVKPLSPVDLLNTIDLVEKCNRVKLPGVVDAKLSTISRLMFSSESIVRLSEKECLLLHALALANQGKLESWQLMQHLNIMDFEKGSKYLGIIVSRLRKKLKKHGYPEHVIKVVRGYGYELTINIELVL